jgi:hypothetical protein
MTCTAGSGRDPVEALGAPALPPGPFHLETEPEPNRVLLAVQMIRHLGVDGSVDLFDQWSARGREKGIQETQEATIPQVWG